MKSGKFIVFEGIDGAGKTTQIALLRSWLEQKKIKCITTKEPTENITGNILKLTMQMEKLSPITDALLFAADRSEHLDKKIKQQLKKGGIIISERYIYANLAFQTSQGVSERFIRNINEFAIQPDLVILLDAPAEVALKRKWNLLYYLPSKFEKSIAFNEKVRMKYLELAKKYDLKVVDASRSIDEVFEDVKKIVAKELKL
ncbi:MAG: dTMP kinase [Candidatus Aenigmatarchaeota archaeon]